MSDLEMAIQRLTAWLRDYGNARPQVFRGDLSRVLRAAKESLERAELTTDSEDQKPQD